jgi:hypothetical protein
MRRLIIVLAAFACLTPSMAHAELYEQIKWCRKGSFAVGLACFVVQKTGEVLIEKSVEEWVKLWISGEGRLPPADAAALESDRWKGFQDFRELMKGDPNAWAHFDPQLRKEYEETAAKIRETASQCITGPTGFTVGCQPKK